MSVSSPDSEDARATATEALFADLGWEAVDAYAEVRARVQKPRWAASTAGNPC